MARLIDAEKTKACIQNVVEHLAEAGNEVMAVALSFAIEIIDNAKTIDPVIRCRDCAVPHNKWTGCPKLLGRIPADDFYCADGVRKDGE